MPQRRDLVEICHQRFDRFWSTSSILLMLRAKDVTGYEQGGIRCSCQRAHITPNGSYFQSPRKLTA
jgi:hypothetical protein